MDMTEEIWRDIEGYEGLYQVSNLGRVKSLNYKSSGKEEILKPQDNGHGYLQVKLCKNGEKDRQLVHRLVAIAFIPNPEGKPEVDHIDNKKPKTYNVVKNLRWVSSRENKNNGISKKVLCVETGVVYISAHEAERMTGAHNQNINKCCRGKQKTVKGFHWQYAD